MRIETIDVTDDLYELVQYQKEILNAFITNPGWYHNPDWDELDKLFEEELWKIKDLKQKNILTMYEIY